LPTLAGYLRSRRIDVIQQDLGIELLDKVLSREFLSEAWRQAWTEDSLITCDREGFLQRRHAARTFADYVINNVEVAKRVMRDRTMFYDLSRYRWATNLLSLACDLASLPNHPTVLSPAAYTQRISFSPNGLIAATEASKENFFYQMFENEVIPRVLNADPILIGISITYHFQVIGGFTLARLLRRIAPSVPVVIGGAIISRMESHLLSDDRLFAFADYFVVGEGELAIAHLAEQLLAGDHVGDAPNLIRIVNGRPYAIETSWVADVRRAPAPDFEGLDLERYLSPEPVLLLSASRGCYWGKCTFCDVSRQTRSVYRPIHRASVLGSIAYLNKRYGARRFFFCDDAIPLGTMQEIARGISVGLREVTWQAEARLEKGITDDFVGSFEFRMGDVAPGKRLGASARS
jgi:hypothetical protein